MAHGRNSAMSCAQGGTAPARKDGAFSFAGGSAHETPAVVPVLAGTEQGDTARALSLEDATVVLGVTGCVAAYKACEIVRALQKRGARVKVVMTRHATRFVDPQQFRALSHEPVGLDLFDDVNDPIPHIALAQEASLMLIAPCTANVAAKIACGIADDLLTTTALSMTAPLMLCPAMNVHMYGNAATQANLASLRARGVCVMEAKAGYLACGDVGPGRLPEPEAIADAVEAALADANARAKGDMSGMRVLVTAGPTVEPIDPARHISNRSSGKTGFALARAARDRGAETVLVTGPVALPDIPGVAMRRVVTALDMLKAVDEAFDSCDLALFSAAVCDFRPRSASERKLKKGADDEDLARIELVRNPDILAQMAARKGERVVVGFAAETEDVVRNARGKLEKKGADMIVGNSVAQGAGFASDDNEAVLVTRVGETRVPRMSKDALAQRILDAALELSAAKQVPTN